MSLHKKNFNKYLGNSVKKLQFNNGKNRSDPKYKTEKDYQNSFDDIIKFSEKFKNKKDIGAIIYHDENNDGVIAAYYAWTYLYKEHGKDIDFFPLKPGHSPGVDKRVQILLPKLNGKLVLILDLSYNTETLNAIRSNSKGIILIDDHPETSHIGDNDKNMFVSHNHAAVASTYKFFYPKNKVPKIAQYVDDSDGKLFLPFISYSNLFALTIGFRFIHNVYKLSGNKLFEELDNVLKDDNPNFFIFIGNYYDEVRENIKAQIAKNAKTANFQGYKVAVLNFNAPALSKVVGRQIITNFQNRGEKIDFAVLWGYEYTAEGYRISLIDDHKQTQINLPQIAKKLGQIGGHPIGGGGHGHDAQFYWSKDIWMLFNKKMI